MHGDALLTSAEMNHRENLKELQQSQLPEKITLTTSTFPTLNGLLSSESLFHKNR